MDPEGVNESITATTCVPRWEKTKPVFRLSTPTPASDQSVGDIPSHTSQSNPDNLLKMPSRVPKHMVPLPVLRKELIRKQSQNLLPLLRMAPLLEKPSVPQ